MIKYEYVSIIVNWTFDDLSIIKQWADNGWKFVCYSPGPPYYAYFERKWKTKQK